LPSVDRRENDVANYLIWSNDYIIKSYADIKINCIIKGCFGEHVTTETKLQIHNITSKFALYHGSENWTIIKRDTQSPEAAQMRFLRPLLGIIRLYRQRNPDIRNRLTVNNLIEDIKLLYTKESTDAAYPN
jgi:hypothetical protein